MGNSVSNSTSINSNRPGYYFSKSKVIYKGTQIPFLEDEGSFRKLGYGYAKSNIRVFYKGNPIPLANPNTFTTVNRNNVKKEFGNDHSLLKLNSVLGMDYLNESKRVYYKGELIPLVK